MRVLQVNNFHFPRGGSDRYFLDLTRVLRDGGVTARTFSTHNERNVSEEWLVVPGVHPISTSSVKGVVDLARFLYSRSVRDSLELALDRFRPHVVHLHIYYGQLTASILAPIVKRGIPIVQTLHEYKTVCSTGGLYANGKDCEQCSGTKHWKALVHRCNRGSFLRSALSCAEMYLSEAIGSRRHINRFIAVSEYQKARLVRLGMPSEKVEVIGNFTDTFSLRDSSCGDYMLYVGRLVNGKGLECLMNAIRLLGDESPVVHIVGDGELRDALVQQVSDLGIEEKVLFKGYLSGDSLGAEYVGAAFLVNPSELNETFGLTVLEAMKVGCPVIAARSGALPELTDNGRVGLLFSPRNAEELAARIKEMKDNASTRSSLGKSGFNFARSLYSKESHFEKILGVYSGLLQPNTVRFGA
ncbi:D-inositol-3-phosphate glycosyltransferase [Thauera mechernichensis]